MFLEYWMIGVLALVFVAGMRSLHRQGYIEGVTRGAEGVLNRLEEENIIVVDSDGVISPSKK
jgi:hypothetical protein